jgi:hypothetical protein
MNTSPPRPEHSPVQHDVETPARRPSGGYRALGWTLMTLSLGLVSCQSLFVL